MDVDENESFSICTQEEKSLKGKVYDIETVTHENDAYRITQHYMKRHCDLFIPSKTQID